MSHLPFNKMINPMSLGSVLSSQSSAFCFKFLIVQMVMGRCSLVNASNILYSLYSPTTTTTTATQFVHTVQFTPPKIAHDVESPDPVFWKMAANMTTVKHFTMFILPFKQE